MNVTELYELTEWIRQEVVAAEIPNKYQQLLQVLQQHAQNQRQTPFEDQKESLIDVLGKVSIDQLSKEQQSFLGNLGIAGIVGEKGISKVEDILYKNVIDIATSAAKLDGMLKMLNQGIGKSNKIFSGLDGCIDYEEYENSDEILMRVTFTGNAGMNNVKDLKSWGTTWYDISRGVAMAHGEPPEAVHVVGATKGSIIIELATVATIAGTVSGIILSALKVAEKVVDIRKKAEELRGLKLQNEKLAEIVEEEADSEKQHGIEQISVNISAELKIESDGEKVNALTKSVKNLVDFVEKGGVVDFVAPEDEGENEDKHAELRLSFEEIRRLEKRLNLLEHKNQ